ncbi:cholecystokinin receptor type A-like [Euwallacea similis]|uniref:cholecystokinin receptor type A-like n=1 Tax=Euwallacea similis TaxID=1736056 RepID=UPI00344E80D0
MVSLNKTMQASRTILNSSLSAMVINVGNFALAQSKDNNYSEPVSENASLENVMQFLSNSSMKGESAFESQLMIPLYIIIFILSIVGNTLVLLTLVRNKRMRTVTNVYLLNLAVADLLLGMFCIPFTLVGQVLRKFIFGEAMCKLIPYFQAVSVSVSVWTLVAISLERYFAICRPLKSRRWQTRSHASKMIAFVWTASLGWSGPILIVSTLQTMKRGHKCRESWPSKSSEQMYNLFLNVILLLIPLSIMSLAYFMIMEKLWKGLQREIEHSSCQKLVSQKSNSSPNLNNQMVKTKNLIVYSENGNTPDKCGTRGCLHCQIPGIGELSDRKRGHYCMFKEFIQVPVMETTTISEPCHQTEEVSKVKENYIMKETTYTFARHGIRSNYIDRSIEAKRKVIRMLFVIVAEFFICWTPLHILNTCHLYYPKEVYAFMGSTGISLVHLLAYVGSCSNPITYGFMNRKFRQTFLAAFKCRTPCLPDTSASGSNMDGRPKNVMLKKHGHNSENSCNDSTLFVGRISYSGRSEPEAEDRV